MKLKYLFAISIIVLFLAGSIIFLFLTRSMGVPRVPLPSEEEGSAIFGSSAENAEDKQQREPCKKDEIVKIPQEFFFQEGDIVELWPDFLELKQGESGTTILSIRRLNALFYITDEIIEVPEGILKEEVKSWVKYDEKKTQIESKEVLAKCLKIDIPDTARPGIYSLGFNVYCENNELCSEEFPAYFVINIRVEDI